MTSSGGEDRAVCWLRSKGYQILARNYRLFGVEIDILTKKNNIYHLFEVKTTTKGNYYKGWYPYSFRQWQRQVQAIDLWSGALHRQIIAYTGIIIIDENFQILDFNPAFFYR